MPPPLSDPQSFSGRTGHRFNHIIRSLPEDPSGGMTIEELLLKLRATGYRGGIEGLRVDLQELLRRGEVGHSQQEGKNVYWCLPRGKLEFRKRSALIRLHNMELSEDEIRKLEEIVEKRNSAPQP
ncbi:MAG: hypothetical protein QFX34_04885 [Candidatus Verstraetearchaeota archaeon]|nr:hypothetical protein [Candidatus Verstraetearchaeota archaeon]